MKDGAVDPSLPADNTGPVVDRGEADDNEDGVFPLLHAHAPLLEEDIVIVTIEDTVLVQEWRLQERVWSVMTMMQYSTITATTIRLLVAQV